MLDRQTIKGIIAHMNEDHADAVLLYVQAFAGHADATSASLVGFDARGMDIRFRGVGDEADCRIEFESPVDSAGDARRLLVKMAAAARQRLGQG